MPASLKVYWEQKLVGELTQTEGKLAFRYDDQRGFCMNLARQVGLPVPEARVVEIAGKRVCQVERYDRHKGGDGSTARLHQEDFCQALGVPPELKYEKEGGPGFPDCFGLVGAWSVEPALDSLNLLRWALFNLLIGNADAHAKNLSFLYQAGGVRPALCGPT